jgi:hypothetical protein
MIPEIPIGLNFKTKKIYQSISNNLLKILSNLKNISLERGPLVNSDGVTLIPELQEVFTKIFQKYSENGFMYRQNVADFIDSCTKDGCKVTDHRVTEVMRYASTPNDYLILQDFLNFYTRVSIARSHITWHNLNAHFYGSNFKSFLDPEDEKLTCKEIVKKTTLKIMQPFEKFKHRIEQLNISGQEWLLFNSLAILNTESVRQLKLKIYLKHTRKIDPIDVSSLAKFVNLRELRIHILNNIGQSRFIFSFSKLFVEVSKLRLLTRFDITVEMTKDEDNEMTISEEIPEEMSEMKMLRDLRVKLQNMSCNDLYSLFRKFLQAASNLKGLNCVFVNSNANVMCYKSFYEGMKFLDKVERMQLYFHSRQLTDLFTEEFMKFQELGMTINVNPVNVDEVLKYLRTLNHSTLSVLPTYFSNSDLDLKTIQFAT